MKLFALITALVLTQSERPADVTGTWQWQGTSGWQRIEVTLKADGSRLTGVIRMGPGGKEPESPSEFWEYFFDPVDFKISNGRIAGSSVTFEHNASRGTPGIQQFTGIPLALGSQSPPSRYLYRGVVQGDQIQMTREVEFNEKDTWALGTHRVEFVLQRVVK